MRKGAFAVWDGPLRGGRGRLTTDSRVLDGAPFSLTTRFGGEPGANPEELIAAAHAGCFSMALAFLLAEAGYSPENIRTSAELSFENEGATWTVTGIHLNVVASISNIDEPEFQAIAEKAKLGCLVSRLVVAPVTLGARLIGAVQPASTKDRRTS